MEYANAMGLDAATVRALGKVCAYCRKRPGELQRCRGCKVTKYCSDECYDAHWPTHKAVCAPPGSVDDKAKAGE